MAIEYSFTTVDSKNLKRNGPVGRAPPRARTRPTARAATPSYSSAFVRTGTRDIVTRLAWCRVQLFALGGTPLHTDNTGRLCGIQESGDDSRLVSIETRIVWTARLPKERLSIQIVTTTTEHGHRSRLACGVYADPRLRSALLRPLACPSDVQRAVTSIV